jgi:hypothetical protein
VFDGLDQLLDFVKVSRLTVSTVRRVTTVQITGAGAEGADSTAETVSSCEVIQPLGLMAYPTLGTGTEALIARIGDNPVALALIDKTRTAQAVEAGGVKMYGPGDGNAAAVVYIRASGAVEVTSKTNTNVTLTAGGTGIVTMQDGSQAFLRGNQFATAVTTFITADNTMLTALTVVMTAIGVFATAVGVAVPAVAAAAVVLNTAIGVFNGAVATRQTAGSALDTATTASLSTKVKGQ